MTRPLLTLAALLAVGLVYADDAKPPKPVYHAAGETTGKVTKVDLALGAGGGKLTLELPAAELAHGRGRSPHVKATTKDLELELAADVKVRFHDAPLKDDKGNPRKPTNEEYNQLRGPEGLPGFKAELSDLKAGQPVKLTLSRYHDAASKSDKTVVTQVMILGEGQPPAEPKKKK